ncbi:MAG: hypothetical protein HZC41_25105 [Chloroflexi bacterium]|nr:hypothetical protein [Chloroflexota bacterium]
MFHNNTKTIEAAIADSLLWATFLARRLERAYQERGMDGVKAKLGEWGDTLTPEDVHQLLQLAGLPDLN